MKSLSYADLIRLAGKPILPLPLDTDTKLARAALDELWARLVEKSPLAQPRYVKPTPEIVARRSKRRAKYLAELTGKVSGEDNERDRYPDHYDPPELVERQIADWLRIAHKIGSPIPHRIIMQRTANLASFRYSTVGHTKAFHAATERLIVRGAISEVFDPKRQSRTYTLN